VLYYRITEYFNSLNKTLGNEQSGFDMRIGRLVKHHIKKIFQHCEDNDHGELVRMTNNQYSKNTFGINYPFCTEVSLIAEEELRRYWTDVYLVRGKSFRVSSQWFDTSKEQFIDYLINKKIATENEISVLDEVALEQEFKTKITIRENSRYKGSAIGNAQNLLVRNILSNLGKESFSENDWKETKDYFLNSCAYCSEPNDLVIEHIIPINRASLGEHRLGNLIPSCKSCNSKKADKNYLDFLSGQPDKIERIEQYMESRNYVPLGDNEQVAQVSKRYIT